MSTSTHITDLIYQSLTRELNADEQAQIDAWISGHPKRATWLDGLEDGLGAAVAQRSGEQLAEVRAELFARITGATGIKATLPVDPRTILFEGQEEADNVSTATRIVHRVHFLRTAWFRYAAAVLLFVGIGAAVWMLNQKEKRATTVVATKNIIPATILPGTNKAVLTLASGRRVELDSATVETITDGGLSIHNTNGQLVYGSSDVVSMNTMTTPKGGQYQLTLADGTKVWLNAASSLTYPTAFTGSTREVEVTGEAYFEVAPNKSTPFIVKTNTDQITVLGTAFNVNAYPDEKNVKTSLVNGAVKVNQTVLKAGEAFQNGRVVATQIDQDVAWINGYFNFNKQGLESVMRQLSRWYNLEVVYEGKIPEITFVGKMTRRTELPYVLQFLEGAGVNFRVEGRRLIVSP